MKLAISALAAVGLASSAMFVTAPALAAACAPRDALAEDLAINYNEESQGTGVASDGSLFEIFISQAGTWSLLITNGGKISCIVAAGDTWLAKAGLAPEAKLEP
jgi:hypothetical protein